MRLERAAQVADEQLAGRVAAGSVEALRELYRRYAPQVAAMAACMSEDQETRRGIVEEAFTALWRLAGSFEPANAGFRSWFLTLAHRRAALRLRRSAAAAERGGPEERERAVRLLRQQALLDDEAARLLAEAYFGARREHELAADSSLPPEAVRRALERALVGLRAVLGGELL